MPVRLDSREADFPARFATLLGSKREASEEVGSVVAAILDDVHKRGDAAVIDYTAPESPSRQIAGWLRGMIASGEIAPGKRLPTEREITELTGVAATTTRRAMRLLAEEGLVWTVPGRGTYAAVREPGA